MPLFWEQLPGIASRHNTGNEKEKGEKQENADLSHLAILEFIKPPYNKYSSMY